MPSPQTNMKGLESLAIKKSDAPVQTLIKLFQTIRLFALLMKVVNYKFILIYYFFLKQEVVGGVLFMLYHIMVFV